MTKKSVSLLPIQIVPCPFTLDQPNCCGPIEGQGITISVYKKGSIINASEMARNFKKARLSQYFLFAAVRDNKNHLVTLGIPLRGLLSARA